MSCSIPKIDVSVALDKSCHTSKKDTRKLSEKLYSSLLLTVNVVKNTFHKLKETLKTQLSSLTLTRVSVHLYSMGMITLMAGIIPALFGNFIPLIVGAGLLIIGASLNGILQVIDPHYYYNLSH